MRPRLERQRIFLKSRHISLPLILTFSIALSISAPSIKLSSRPNASIHNIDTGLDYETIQEAIDANETTSGHTLLVENGTYHEQVIIDKALRLRGSDRDTTIIDGNGAEKVVSITASNTDFSGFTVQNGEWGVDLQAVKNASVTENNMFNCFYGAIKVHGCLECSIANNTVVSKNQAGIYLYQSVENMIAHNRIENTSHGIWLLAHSRNNLIKNNFATNNPQGIVLSYNCNNNTIVGNTVISSRVGGIVMGGAHNNTIFHNNVLNSTNQAWSYGNSSNLWDDGTEGNFWEDYLGTDSDEDGIGDNPYSIGESNWDNNPLMGIFTDCGVKWQGETYHIYVISNSTVSALDFKITYEPEVRKAIGFNVTGRDDAAGFCRVMIPTALVNHTYSVLVNEEEVEYTVLNVSNSTHAYLYFTYNTSTKRVIIIPEFPSALILFLCGISFLAIVLSKKEHNNTVINLSEISMLYEVDSIAKEQIIYTRLKTKSLRIFFKMKRTCGKGS